MLQHILETTKFKPKDQAIRLQRVIAAIQTQSSNLAANQPDSLSDVDLKLAFRELDAVFLQSALWNAVTANKHRLTFRVSQRMTSSGGSMVTRRIDASRNHYEIAVAGRLLHQTYVHNQTVLVCGLRCSNFLLGLCRIIEHEALHLAEMISWKHSNCSSKRFKSLAADIFGHRASNHNLLTSRRAASVHFNLRLGDIVSFPHQGRVYTGTLNRITSRGTVLVPDALGEQYSDGKRYAKFYVPMRLLQPATAK